MDTQHPLKIVMLTSSYPRGKHDTASIFLRHLAEELQQQGLIVHVLAPADKNPGSTLEDGVHVKRFSYAPFRLRRLAYRSGILPNLKNNPWLWFLVPFFLVAMMYSLVQLIRKTRPDIIHAHWVLPQGIIALFTKIIFNIPVVITTHGSDVFGLRSKTLQKIKQYVLRHCDVWTSNTSATVDAIVEKRSASAQIIPMGVNCKQFSSGIRDKFRVGIPSDEMIILFVGRLVESKGVDDLIKAYSLLPGDLKRSTNLWIIGDGKMKSELEDLAHSPDGNNRIEFLGTMPNDLLPDYFAAADLFVGPSVVTESGPAEGQGIVFLEAFAARLCVVATRVGGIPEVIDDGRTGLLVEPRQTNQLAENIARSLTDAPLRNKLATNAYKEVNEKYDWTKIATTFHKLFLDLYYKYNAIK